MSDITPADPSSIAAYYVNLHAEVTLELATAEVKLAQTAAERDKAAEERDLLQVQLDESQAELVAARDALDQESPAPPPAKKQ